MNDDQKAMIEKFEKMSPTDLEGRRRELVLKASGNFEINLSEEECSEVAFIAAVLRRMKGAGPPKEAKPSKAKGRGKTLADIEALL